MAKHDKTPTITHIHPSEFHLDRGVTRSPWWVRQAVYCATGTIGLIVTAFGIASPDQVTGWENHIASIAAMLSGALAASATGEHSDYRPTGRPAGAATTPAEDGTLQTPTHPTNSTKPTPTITPQGGQPGHPTETPPTN